MTTSELLAERHIQENQARLKHIDELMTRVQNESGGAVTPEAQEELAELRQERDKFADYVQQLQQKTPEHLLQMEGPMVMWELIAERLERLVQRIEM